MSDFPKSEESDRSLLRRLNDGNEQAAVQIYARYVDRLRALARAKSSRELSSREEPEDIVQSAFGSFFRGVQGGGYEVPAGRDLWNLLLVITLNKIRAKGRYYRAAKRDVRMTRGSELLEQHQFSEQLAVADRSSIQSAMEDAIEGLPPLPQKIIALRIEGHGLGEIAKETKRSYRTVERVLKSFREVMAESLSDEG